MSELSKTARASMGKVVKETHVETTEEAIRALRINREAGLFIGDMSRVDKLLARYDEAVNENVRLQFETGSLGLRNEALTKQLDEADQKLLDVSSAYDAVKNQLENVISGEPAPEPTVVMAEFDNREEPGA